MLELIRTAAAVDELRPQWDELHGRCESSTPFQSAAWLLPWARHFAPDRFMAIGVRDRYRLVALVPFFSWKGRLLLAGTGSTDYCDGLFAGPPSCAGEVLRALTAHAEETGCGCIDLQQLPPRSPLLSASAPPEWVSEVGSGTPCPVTRLSKEDALASVSPRWRKNVAQARRRLRKRSQFDVRCATTRLFENAAAELIRLHSARWSARDQAGVLADPLMQGFLASALPEMSATGLLRLHSLEVSDRRVAVLLALHRAEMTCFYIGGFDPQWSAYSPGNILLEAAMIQAACDGAREFHFLRGCEAYKYHFGALDEPTFRRTLTRVGLTTDSSNLKQHTP